MFSLIVYIYKRAGKIVISILVAAAPGCNNQTSPVINVSPKNFKVQIPFILNSRGIIINTYWGAEKKHHVLCLDNYSPSWIKSPVIKYDKSFNISKDHHFSSTTADGTPIHGDIDICDSLIFEGLTFINAPFYVMPYNANDNVKDDGVFGSELMSKGIWKVDFKQNMLTLASSIDSLKEIRQAEIFPSTFSAQSITIDVTFGNNMVERMAVDLGFNGYLLIPSKEFTKISKSKQVFTDSARFSTPASRQIVNSLSVFDTVNINHNWFISIVSSNETVKERLIGLQFFKKFDFVIFDFINKRIYLPKKVW